MSNPSPGKETVYFVYRDLEEVRAAFDIDNPPPSDELSDYLLGGRRNWVVRTYIELLRRDLPVRLVDYFPRGKICVAHVDDVCTWDWAYSAYLVVVRADRPPVFVCEHSIVQTPVLENESRSHYLAYWPQSGLQPRDPNRAARVERVGFVGREYNLASSLRSDAFKDQLASMGMQLVIKGQHHEWGDYRDLDVILALRDIADHWIVTKPATKLYNSWHGGCPAILGREPAFEALRQSELDYISIESASDAVQALRRLRGDATMYTAMVENGFRRAEEFTSDAVAARWREFLWGPVATRYRNWQRYGAVKQPVRLARFACRVVREKIARHQSGFLNKSGSNT